MFTLENNSLCPQCSTDWSGLGLITLNIIYRFSTNEGETWTDFQFSDKEVYVYQLLTEPGEKSTIFTIFGSYANQRHSWLILQVNTSDVLGRWSGTGRFTS